MKAFFPGLLILPILLIAGPASLANTSPETLARLALADESAESQPAVTELRSMGPAGLNVLFRVYAEDIKRQTAGDAGPHSQRLNAVLDEVSQQKDSYLSGLYWYTDIAQAKAAARTSGRPILSLRLLGKLSEEYSCANSRFFRTVLYSNATVSKLLREQFVLHWQSVRPAPRVTIDFGDGRKLEQTITGNSIHYILDADGKPLDALPGLYGPQSFVRGLNQVRDLYDRVKLLDPTRRVLAINFYHRAAVPSLTQAWLSDIQKVGGKVPDYLAPKSNPDGTSSAVVIAPIAVTKALTELSVLRGITRDAEALGNVTDEVTWTKIALQHIEDAKLDEQSIGLIRRQTQQLFATSDGSGITPEIKLANLVQKLQLSIALDTVRNEYMLRPKLHAWLVTDRARFDVDALNEKVYAELFHTPRSDPWLGLFSPDVYMALEKGGVTP